LFFLSKRQLRRHGYHYAGLFQYPKDGVCTPPLEQGSNKLPGWISKAKISMLSKEKGEISMAIHCVAQDPMLCAHCHHHLLVGLVARSQAGHPQANAQRPLYCCPTRAVDDMETAELLCL
jgi:hypothetical protein